MPKIKKIYYNKLIRDKIPQVMEKSGARYNVHVISQKQFKEELLKKVGEEASGLLTSKNKIGVIQEIGDVITVIEEIKRIFKITDREIKQTMVRAFKRKGGFRKRLYLVWSEDTGYRTNERRNTKK
ncbi:MAG: nucleoside triphosphate pyrophosphohydrolase [Patescibacteria group bacterium]|nr:nucleoside triphosphate pyrophosphohydrolase [Patescibacteria group bacterium]